ncbi:putative ankyrin-repeat protein [Gnomoniopsis sp. IMI 355080]|nr:putative ankyrin-repeat protein [Gnomoniopsis sp. IMI 355080]
MDTDTKFAIHAACREGKLSTVQSLLNVDPKLSTRKDDDGRLPIHWAASANQLDIVQLLAEQKGFDVDTKDDMGWTPLMIAASVKDSEKLVVFLLSKGADPNEKSKPLFPRNAPFPGTVLHFVASKNYLDIARLLVSHQPPASARVRDKRGQYALHRAAAIGSVPMINLLVAQKSPLNATDADGQTALHHAVAEGHGDAAVALLKAGAELAKEDAEGKTPLDLAPDKEVRKYIERMAESEGIEL